MYERKEVKWVKNIHKSKQEISDQEDKELEIYKNELIKVKIYEKDEDDIEDSEYICSYNSMERCRYEENDNKDKSRPQAKYDKDEN
eukprot:CAMPEP_0172519544 /NCGR_PEP_ID=MMETSP1066-20121228/291474_1 /TAXON_ID=671091 /ORGANISM="Coscinodiscus wailesii, Strain CCMP2513" /LENGTH=85 /DNA_ID=CAMNT_0013302149 /DNA_START=630 /DNA_END=887 /DNA_ORIENTATION=-